MTVQDHEREPASEIIQNAGAFRLLKVWCLVLSAALLVVIVLLAFTFSKTFTASGEAASAAAAAKSAAASNTSVLHSQEKNRATNVSTWCDAINGVQGELEHFVNESHFVFHGSVLMLSLPKLPCRAIIARTKSTSTRR
jgi:hypothetical protein